MSNEIDISGLNRDELLEALWYNSKPAGFFAMMGIPGATFDITEAKKELRNGYADYICGRVIKADVYSGDTADPKNYDRDNGQGAFRIVVDFLRSESNE